MQNRNPTVTHQVRTMSRTYLPPLTLFVLVALPGCSVIEGIFKAGVWAGVIAVLAVVGLVVWGLARFAGRR